LDFLQDQKDFKNSLKIQTEKKVLRNWIHREIYKRIHLLKDSLNTHPICYIGGDNMGYDQILSLPGGKNRNSHGTYPFPGIWKHIGLLAAAEKINGGKKYKFEFPTIDRSRFLSFETLSNEPHYIPMKNPKYVTFTRDDIILVPDWECVKDLVISDPEVRRKWYFMLLPIHSGFPMVESPGAGLIKKANLGNMAPFGFAYNSGWNRAGATSGYENYDPHVLPTQFLFGLQDNFINNWGCFNLTWPTFKSLPIINLLWSLTGAQFEFKPKFFPRNKLPFRFFSLVYRPSYSFGDNNFAFLLPMEKNKEINSFLANSPGTAINKKSFKQNNYFVSKSFMFNINLGRYASENTFSASRSKVKYNISDGSGKSIGTVKGDLKFYEFIGSLKHCFFDKKFQPFLRLGYGWNWYRAENVRLNGQSIRPSQTQWFHNPSILPNAGHVGAGIEIFAKRNSDISQKQLFGQLLYIGKPEIGLRIEYTFHFHKLGKDAPINDWIYRHEVGVGLVVSF